MANSAIVHVIDDDEAVRDSLAFLLTAAKLPVRTHESASMFLEQASGVSGCIITDVRMPEIDGLELLRRLRKLGVNVPVIVITGHGDVPLAVEAMKAGAVDFFEKPFDDEALLTAVRAALHQHQQVSRREEEKRDIGSRLDTLSQREREVLELLVDGKPNKVIAYELGISPRTVEIYRANVMTKMRANSLSDLVRMALVAGVTPAIS